MFARKIGGTLGALEKAPFVVQRGIRRNPYSNVSCMVWGREKVREALCSNQSGVFIPPEIYNPMRNLMVFLSILTILCVTSGCSKRMVVPGILAGTGAVAMVGGTAYRLSLPENDSVGLLGRQPQQKAGISILLFAGAALVLAGVIWAATTPVCESDSDCWRGDVCEKSTGTCVVRPADDETTNESVDMAILMMDKHVIDPLDFNPIPAFPWQGKGKMMAAGFESSKYALKLYP